MKFETEKVTSLETCNFFSFERTASVLEWYETQSILQHLVQTK